MLDPGNKYLKTPPIYGASAFSDWLGPPLTDSSSPRDVGNGDMNRNMGKKLMNEMTGPKLRCC